MKIRDLPRAKEYPAVGRCIYCGCQDPPLTTEHVIPYGLEGNLTLPGASCARCQNMTRWIETTCLRGQFLGPRTHLNIRTRRPGQRPTTLPMGVYDGAPMEMPLTMEARRFRWEYLPIEESPTSIVLPVLERPDLLTGNETATHGLKLSGLRVKQLRAAPASPDGTVHGDFAQFHVEAFCRMIAKIAHAAAVAELGLDCFKDPVLPDYILRRRFDYNRVIGTSRLGRSRRDSTVAGSLHFERGYVTARVQLFANFGFKPYQVVVGKPGHGLDGYLYSAITCSTQTL